MNTMRCVFPFPEALVELYLVGVKDELSDRAFALTVKGTEAPGLFYSESFGGRFTYLGSSMLDGELALKLRLRPEERLLEFGLHSWAVKDRGPEQFFDSLRVIGLGIGGPKLKMIRVEYQLPMR